MRILLIILLITCSGCSCGYPGKPYFYAWPMCA